MYQSTPLQWSRRTVMVNYAVAALSVVAALLAGVLLHKYLQTSPFVSLFLCAIMFSAWFGGLGAGLLATALTLLAFTYFFVPPYRTLEIAFSEFLRVGLLAAAALFAVWLNVARRDALVALERSQAYLDEAQWLSHTGSFGWKIASGEIVWSKEMCRIFGVDQTVKPTLDLIMERVHPDDRQYVNHVLHEATHGGHKYEFEHRLLMPDGTVKHLQVRARRTRYDVAEEEIVGAMMDVTSTKEAQEALHLAQAEVARVARVMALAEMSASIAHEVNQPLAAIKTDASAGLHWLDRDVPELNEARAAVSRISQNANRASGVIRKVCDLAKRSDPEATQLDVNDVVDEAVALIRQEAMRHSVTIRLQLAPGLPFVRGDRIQLEQVVVNLAINAVQAMAAVTDCERVLTIRTEGYGSDQVIVTVHDVGVGLESGSVDQLFHAFYTTKPEGMGMGLAICRSIIEAHGGRVWASNNAGPGMTFKFLLSAYREGR